VSTTHHRAFIVTGSSFLLEPFEAALEEARRLFGDCVTAPVPVREGVITFFVAPSGAKNESQQDNERARKEIRFLAFLSRVTDSDWQPVLEWAFVVYGSDDGERAEVLASS
jgi:hypothetical protein